jgi:methylmalonyl-CoA mutase cobalamin-binding domain/chain
MIQATNGNLASALLELEEKDVERLVSDELARGVPPETILEEMRQGMTEIGNRFAGGTYFLTELIMAAEIFGQTMKKIEPRLTGGSGGEAGDVVFATVKGDVHDIGKNIIVAMLRGADFRVHDLGVDVPPERIIEKLKETGAGVLGLSALLTTSFDSMKATVEALARAGLRDHVKVMVGGGPVDERVRAYVGADVCGRDAQQAVNLARQFAAVEV